MAIKPVWGPTPEQVANDKLNRMVEYSEALAGAGVLFRAADPQPAGLNYAYLAGRIRKADGTIIEVAAGSVALTGSATNYIEVDNTGVVSVSTAAFTDSKRPLARVVTDSGSVTSIVDKRVNFDFGAGNGGGANLAWEGPWETATEYAEGDIVQNGDPVSSYHALANHTSGASTEPGEGEDWEDYWEVIAGAGGQGEPGEQGLPGGSLNWRNDWANATAYSVDDAVQDGTRKSSYRCHTAHTSGSTNRPGLGANWTSYWTLLAQAGEAGAAGATGAPGSPGTNGLNGVVWKGAWDDFTAYAENDAVSHNGSSYVCTSSHTNQEPPNGSYWDVLAAEGDVGPEGPAGGSMNWLGDWEDEAGYAVNDAVQNGSPKSSYRCHTAHTAGEDNEPGVGVDWQSYWTLFAEAGSSDADTLDGEDGAHYLNRTNHTGTQAISTVTGLQDALDGKASSSHNHDDRYYTESEIDALLEGFEPGGGGGDGIEPVAVEQAGHGLSVGDYIKVTGNDTYAKAQADSAANAEIAGRVSTVTDSDNFKYLPVGLIVSGSGWTAGEVRFLDPATPGATTATPPSTEGQIVKPVLLPINLTEAILLPYVGYAVPGEGGGGGSGGDADTLEGENGTYYLNRTNHTGTQAISTVSGLQSALDALKAETICVAISDETSELIVGDGIVKFRMPFAMTLTSVRASLSTASTDGDVVFDIKQNGAFSSILSTRLSIDEGEKTSTTAATPAVISNSTLSNDAEMIFDIYNPGTGATGAKIYLIGVRT